MVYNRTMTHAPDAPARFHRAASACVEAGWLATVVLVPLAVNPWGFNHELPKVALLRALTLLMLAAHLLALAWTRASSTPLELSPHAAGRIVGGLLRRPLVRPVLLVAGVALLSTLTSISPLVSLRGTYHRQQGACLQLCLILWALMVAARLRTPTQRRRLVTAIVVAGSLVALTPFVEALVQGKNPLTERLGGALGNPIFLGAYLIMVIPFTLAHAIANNKLQIAALALQLFALMLTQSRGPWVGALVGLAVFAALTLWHRHRRLVLAGLIAVPLLIGGLALGLNFGLAPSTRLSELPYVQRIALPQGLYSGTVRVRLVLWRAAAQVVTAWPEVGLSPHRLDNLRPVLGYGPDTAAIVYTANYPPELAHIEDPNAIWDRAHNETLDLLTMQGWLGLAASIVLGVACARRGLSLWRAEETTAGRAWVAAPLAALTAHLVEAQFAFSMTATGMMTWLCVAWLAEGQIANGKGDSRGNGTQPEARWRVYGTVGALLLALTAARLEGASLWADTLTARARALDRAGEWKESVELYDQALALTPWQATYHQFRAEAFYNLARALPEEQTALKGELLAAAERSLARARRLEPLEVEHYSNSGVLHAYWSEAVDAAHLETAAAFYHQAFRLAPTRAELRADLGHMYHNHGLYARAIAQYGAALDIDPQFATAHYDSALAWLELGKQDLAREAFRATLELAPDCGACQDALQALGE